MKILHENALFSHNNFKNFLGRGISPFQDPIPYPSAPLFKISGSATGIWCARLDAWGSGSDCKLGQTAFGDLIYCQCLRCSITERTAAFACISCRYLAPTFFSRSSLRSVTPSSVLDFQSILNGTVRGASKQWRTRIVLVSSVRRFTYASYSSTQLDSILMSTT